MFTAETQRRGEAGAEGGEEEGWSADCADYADGRQKAKVLEVGEMASNLLSGLPFCGLCKKCHYDLRSLPEPRCPECGTAFDPGDPNTFLDTLDHASPRRMQAALLCLGPFVLVGMLICVEFVYASTARPSPALASLPPFYRYSLRVELLLLLLALLNVPLMPWHLSAIRMYSGAKRYVKVALGLGAALAYFVMVLGAMLIVVMIHDW